MTNAEAFRLWLQEKLPAWMFETAFLIETWQWAALLIFVFLGVIADRVVTFVLRRAVRRYLVRQKVDVEDRITKGGLRPFGILAMGLVWWIGLALLDFPGNVQVVVGIAVKFVAVGGGVWTAYRLVDVVSAAVAQKAAETESRFDDLLVPLVRKSLKIFITVFGLVFVASNIPNLDITSLVTGLGLGGLAFALAAKDVVSNVFGTLTIILDRPYEVGDWVIIGDVEGTVELVGFRSTRVRTFYNSLVSIPNSTQITAVVDNMGKRRYRRFKTNFSLSYRTPPEKIEAFCEGVRELVRLHPCTRKDYYHVCVNSFGEHAIQILFYIFHEAPDWSVELRERHRLILDVLKLAAKVGVEFAYPQQIVELARGPSEDPEIPDLESAEAAREFGRDQARDVFR